MSQQPSVGRVVHYVSHGTPLRPDGSQAFTSQCRAALISEVDPAHGDIGLIGLVAINPTGLFFHSLADGGCVQDEHDKRGGSWHWPERI